MAGAYTGLREGLSALVHLQVWSRRAVPRECRGVGSGAKPAEELVSPLTALSRYLCTYAKGQRRGMVAPGSCFPWETSLQMPPLTDALEEEPTVSLMPSALGLFACFFSRSRAVPSGLYVSQAHQPLNTSLWVQLVEKTHENQAFTFSYPKALGKCPPCVYSSMLHSLSPFSMTIVLSSLQHLWSVSPPNYVSAHPTFLNVTSSILLVWQFVLSVLKSIFWVFRISW